MKKKRKKVKIYPIWDLRNAAKLQLNPIKIKKK